MSQLVAEEFAHLIVRSLVALRHTRSCRRLLPLILGLDVESSFVGHCRLIYSTYAGGKCD